MSNKTTKDAVEQVIAGMQGVYGDKWLVEGASFIYGFFHEAANKYVYHNVKPDCAYCTKQQFEDYVKEQKMEKQKYKYVPATGMDIWDLGKEISLGATYFDECNNSIYIDSYGCLKTVRWDQGGLAIKLEQLQITTRQPLPWYEVEGALPCIGRTGTHRLVEAFSVKGNFMIDCLGSELCGINDFTRLTENELNAYANKAGKYEY